MRVIAGRFRGRRLRAPSGAATRPTSDRVKEAVFSLLGAVDDAAVLDLFAGSGALGIEALSRHAASAAFVEQAPAAVAVLRANLETLGLEPPVARVHATGAGAAMRAATDRGETYDLVFIDPPYARAEALVAPLRRDLPGLIAPGGRVVCETDRRSPIDLGLPLRSERRYGDTLIRIHATDPDTTGSR